MGARLAQGHRLTLATLVGWVALLVPAAAQDQAVGARFEVRAGDMPAPFATDSAVNPPRRIARPAGARPNVPPGFEATLFADGLDHARWMAVAENGDVLVAEPGPGKITLLRDADGDGAAEFRTIFAERLDRPHGLAIRDGHLYVGMPRQIVRFAYRAGQERAGAAPQAVSAEGALGDGQGHSTRNLAFSADGATLYISVGSRGNAAVQAPPRATVQALDMNDRSMRTLAAGLRNPVGIVIHPETAELYVVVNERDGMGDGLVSDYLTHVEPGAFYGWPFAYIGANPDPQFGKARPALVASTRVPDVLFQAHSAPLGLVIYDADQFPAAYRGDAFVALHGSWNADAPVGYMVRGFPSTAVVRWGITRASLPASGRPASARRGYGAGRRALRWLPMAVS